MKRWLFAGIFSGVLSDRICIYKVLKEKNDRIEKAEANILVLEEWLAMHNRGYSMVDVLKGRRCWVVAIYGMGILGNHLYQELENSDIRVKYIIDRRPIKGVYHAEVCSAEEKLSGVDAVIVTSVYQFEEMERQIRQSNDVQVISLLELLDTESFGYKKEKGEG